MRSFCRALLLALLVGTAGTGRTDVAALVRSLSLDEKIALVHGSRDPLELGQAGYWAGLPQRGIPPLRFADGPPGVSVNRDATAMPAPIALAATFDVAAARLYGDVMGAEAKALQQDVLLTPYVNIVRDPLFRRNHTTLGEDPLLSARIGAAEIAAIQKQGVMAQVKHFAAYNGPDSVVIDERTLHELYLPPFEAAVNAGVASVMCGYHKINGEWACENAGLLEQTLRDVWGFRGFVTSDWGALHSTQAITKGTDLEMPGRELAGRPGGPYLRESLKSAVENGAIPMAALDRAVTRILQALDRFGYLDRKTPSRAAPVEVEGHARVVRQMAERGAVLLKNERGILPLTADDLSSLTVIGPTAGQLAAGFMGERAYGFEARMISPLDALRRSVPAANVKYAVGVDLTGAAIPGLESEIQLAAGRQRAWSGTLPVAMAGDYTFLVQPLLSGGSDGGGAIQVDGQAVAQTGGPGVGGAGKVSRKWSSLLPTTDGRDNARGTIHLTAGAHRVDFSASSTGEGTLEVRFAWITPPMRRTAIDAAVQAARSARTAVVFAWSVPGGSTLSLAEDQDELIERVAAVNSRTVVVLNSGGPVAMPWVKAAAAILELWYPGQEGGWATANLLLGRAAPGGRLPVTFPVRLQDAPAWAPDHPERRPLTAPPGSTGLNAEAAPVVFSEGMAVGYRWYDQQGIEPLFPFGHGLSYTRFEYSSLTVKPAGEDVEVAFTLRNAGKFAGSEVAQVYLEPPVSSPVAMPPQSLVTFARVDLRPGESRRVTLRLQARAFSYWSSERHGWQVVNGARSILIAASSRDIRLRGQVAPGVSPGR
ncbi:MAG: glycoside hydrolase family 3 C-terminal domain-containing protein [Candidatus Solibacter sp.]